MIPAADSAQIPDDAADAEVLELAEQVLRRRYGTDIRGEVVLHLAPERIRFTAFTLQAEADKLRGAWWSG